MRRLSVPLQAVQRTPRRARCPAQADAPRPLRTRLQSADQSLGSEQRPRTQQLGGTGRRAMYDRRCVIPREPMNFTDTIRRLREEPIPIDDWKDHQVGENNGGPYKANYPLIPVEDDGREELVDVATHGLVSSDFYMDQLLKGDQYLRPALDSGYLWSRAFARASQARLLARADAFLRANGLFLFIASAWRHPAVQKIITADYAARYGADQARRMFAPVVDGQAPPPHATGAAFDLEIWSLDTGQRLEMYYIWADKHVYNAYAMERLARSSPADPAFSISLQNRRILYHVLCTKGVVFESDHELFCNHPGEFWHFGSGDPLSAFLSQQRAARYGAAFPRSTEGQRDHHGTGQA
jgi:D-alanyl-D-alanine dipeptidase